MGALYTTSCNTQSSAPEDGQNNCPKDVELIGIINKLLLLHLLAVYIIKFMKFIAKLKETAAGAFRQF
jgi:hypothetical protein